ncbi:MAG TPA: hypothetical protein VFL57_13565 [Bryobacteraceae bacterium]|nr:hypothetical protein [Bryobacteraceae bacterium]
MARVLLIHWKHEEAGERLELLRQAGFDAELGALDPRELLAIPDNPPDAIVIDLGRLPSHGREVGGALRRRKATRNVPIVFAGGSPEAVAKVKSLLPDATFTDWSRIGPALSKALRSKPAEPVVPGAMAGYSGTPLPRKLGIKPNTTVALLGAPPGFETKLEPLPEGVRVRRRAGTADRVLLFVQSSASLAEKFAAAAASVQESGGLWLVWPKKTSRITTDLGEAQVRKFGLAAGWVDYKICAVDETWSGLQFARRAGRAARAGK